MTLRSKFKEGDLLFHQGSAGDRVLRIVEGEVEVLREIAGALVVLGHARAGEWLGEMAVIENRSRSATARATTDGVVEILTAPQFLDLISRDPAMARDVILRLSVRLRRVDDKFASEVATSAHGFGGPDSSARQETEPHDAATILLMANSDALRARIGASEIPVEKLPFVVGRVHLDAEGASSTAPDLLIEDNPPFRLSRQHFMIARSGESLLVSDLGSALGTIVNGQPIGHHFMRDTAPLVQGNNDIVAGGRGSQFQFVVSVD
jgi:CRP/FNR family transcriptional regulator, cyclic AMP receptor protein